MNRTTLLLMFALVCAAGAAVMLRRAPEKRSPTGGDPLATVNWAGVRSLHCRRADGQEWTMLLKGGEWWLESPTVAEGRAVAANDQLRLNIFGVLHDVIPLESRPVAEISKGEWGLEPPELAVTIRDADGEVAIHFGRPDLNQELYYCTPDGKAVYKTDKLSVEELARDVVWLREPRLIDTNLEAAFFVEITPRDAPAYSLERSGLLWLIVHPDGSRRRADHTLTEQVVNGLCRMEGEPVTREDLGVELPEDPYCRITVRDGAGKQNIYDILYVDDNEQFLIAKRPDEPDYRRVKGLFRRFLRYRAQDLEDALFANLEIRDLAAIDLKHTTSDAGFRLQSVGAQWRLVLSDDFGWFIDAVGLGDFRDRLMGMRVAQRLGKAPEFEPAIEVVFELNDVTKTPPVRLRFSAPDAKGNRFATRSDEEGAAIIDAEAAMVLDTPYWKLLGRNVSAGQDSQIDHIAITDGDGTRYQVSRLDQDNWNLVSVTKDGEALFDPKNREVPADFLDSLLVLLTWFKVESYLGPPTAEQLAGFKEPRYVVSWFHPEPEHPGVLEGPWVRATKVFEVGDRYDDEYWVCRINTFPNLVFKVSGETFLRFEDALRGMGKK